MLNKDRPPLLGTLPDLERSVDREIIQAKGCPANAAAGIQVLLPKPIAASIHDEVHGGKLPLILHTPHGQNQHDAGKGAVCSYGLNQHGVIEDLQSKRAQMSGCQLASALNEQGGLPAGNMTAQWQSK